MNGEFEFIKRLRERRSSPSKIVKSGIGDDAAVVRENGRFEQVITTDLLIEDVDFRREWLVPEFLGHKALAVSLSDVAAMGAKPVWAMLSIGIPADVWETDFVEKFYQGWFALADKHKIALVGGDVSRSPDKIVIDSIVAGETRKNHSTSRSGAKAGDSIFVTGDLGGASAGLQLLENGFRWSKESTEFMANSDEPSNQMSDEEKLALRQLRPTIQTEIGKIIGEQRLATAMIDVSDGLSSDLAHLCRASNVGARIHAARLPINSSINGISKSKPDALTLALHGGEDFQLLFTVRRGKLKILQRTLAKFRAAHIGEITGETGQIEFVQEGQTTFLEPNGFRHF